MSLEENPDVQISVVIPSYLAGDNLSYSLDAIQKQTINKASLEVIVVDCSPDNNVRDICANYDFVQFSAQQKRFSPGEGRNIGANLAKGQTLVFIDSDVILKQDALSNVLSNIAQPKVRIFGGALDLASNKKDYASVVEHYYFNHESQSARPTQTRNNLSSAFMVIEKALFLEVGGFKNIPRMQDTELTERIRKSGIELWFCPDVVGYQIQDSALKKVFKKIYITGNNLYFIRYASGGLLKRLALFFMLPLMMLIKITRINVRHIKYSRLGAELLIVIPSMYLCGIIWMCGFYRALIKNDGIATGR